MEPPPDPRPPAPDWFDRRPLALLALFALAFYWKLTLTNNQFTCFETPDLAYQVLPWYQMQARAMHAGVFPLWDPFQWSGQPLAGQMQPGTMFPLNWPLFLSPLKNGYLQLAWVHRHFVLIHLLAAWFMFAWCRQAGASRFASVTAGAAFSFSGYVGTTAWPQMLHGAMWIPLVFLFFDRAMERHGLAAWANAAWCGGAAGLSVLSGHHQAPMYTGLTVAGVWAWQAWTRRGERLRLCGRIAVIAAFAALVGAAQILPAWEYGARAYRWVELASPVRIQDTVPYFAQYNLGIFPLSFLGVLWPKAYLTTDPFLGFVCLSFALFAVAAGWDRPAVRRWALVALAAALYAAGHYSLLHGLAYAVAPFLDKARSPGHAIFVFQFAALTLSAHGIDLWFAPQAGQDVWRRRILKGLVYTGLLAWALLFWLYLNLKFETNPGDHVILSSIVAWVLAAVLYAVRRGHLAVPAARWAVVLLLLFEMSITSYFFFSHRDDPKRAVYLKKLHEPRHLMAFLKAQSRPFRFDVAGGQETEPNLGDWEGLEQTRGYLASISDRLYDFVGWDWGKALLVLNTVYTISKEAPSPGRREVFADGEWKVYRNERALPRAWIVYQVRQAPDARQAAQIFRSPAFDPRGETILIGEQAPAIEPCPAGGTVSIEWHGLHRIRARTRSACPGIVVFAEPDFPGWRARLDARPAPLLAPFGALRAVAAPAGEHTIELIYRPASVYLGGALSAFGLALCGGLALKMRQASR